jgi:NADH dehydrogenase
MILVTGGTGFVGGHVVHALRANEQEVRALVRNRAGSAKLESWGVEPAEGDVTNPESVRRAVAGAETVVHLVAIRQGKREEFQRVMVDGTRNLLAAAKETGVGRFVQMSALGTSAETKDLVPYFNAKWQMEQDVKASGIPYVIFRPSFVFGSDAASSRRSRLARLTPVTPRIGAAGCIQPSGPTHQRNRARRDQESRRPHVGISGPEAVTGMVGGAAEAGAWDQAAERPR